MEMEENIDEDNSKHEDEPLKKPFPALSENENRSMRKIDNENMLSQSESSSASNENNSESMPSVKINQSSTSVENNLNAILDENIEESKLEYTDYPKADQFEMDPDQVEISASEIPDSSSATRIISDEKDFGCASSSSEVFSPPTAVSFSQKTVEPDTRRLSQRKCVMERNRKRKKTKISTGNEFKFENNLRGALPSLKELALNHLMKLRYICKVKSCRSKMKSFLNIDDFCRHSTHHEGSFRCHFCKFKTNYARSLSSHEINCHSQKIEDNVKNMHKCPRCALDFFTLRILKVHHLKSHLKLMPDRRTCRICRLPETPIRAIEDVAVKSSMEHYSVFHDLTGVDLETVERCDKPNCRAYFRTPRQLKRHCDWVHEGSGESERVSGGYGKYVKPVLRLKKEGSKSTPSSPVLSLSPHAKKMMAQQKNCNVGKCGRVCYSKEDFETHSKLHGKFKCKTCHVVLNYAKKLYLHEKAHLKRASPAVNKIANMNKCPRCDYSVSCGGRLQPKLMGHFLEEHLGLKMDVLTCPVCNAKFHRFKREGRKNPLLNHLRNSHDFSATVYECEIPGCHAYFNSNIQLITHRNNHKAISNSDSLCSGSKKTFHCNVCGKGFNFKGSLLHHQRTTHLKHLPFSCPSDACLERFESQEDLARHTSANEVVVCPQCGKSYHGYSGLNMHLKFHERHKDRSTTVWICDVCGKDFKGEEALRLHKFSHTGPDSWEYVCDLCGKKSLTHQKLDEHKRTHSKEKPFTCEHCGVSYAHRHNLRIHINKKHSDIASDPPKKFDRSRLVSRKGVKLNKNAGLKPTAENEKSKCNKRRQTRTRRRSPSLSSGGNSDSDD